VTQTPPARAGETIAATGPSMGSPSKSTLDRVLGMVPRALASHTHIIFLGGLLVYLVLLPLAHLYTPSSQAMLIGGNWTNVTGDLGACIAAGGTVTLARQGQQRRRAAREALQVAQATHRIMADLYKHSTGTEHQNAPKARY
jgi:hypothetical protein